MIPLALIGHAHALHSHLLVGRALLGLEVRRGDGQLAVHHQVSEPDMQEALRQLLPSRVQVDMTYRHQDLNDIAQLPQITGRVGGNESGPCGRTSGTMQIMHVVF
jgi:hypothetical protein